MTCKDKSIQTLVILVQNIQRHQPYHELTYTRKLRLQDWWMQRPRNREKKERIFIKFRFPMRKLFILSVWMFVNVFGFSLFSWPQIYITFADKFSCLFSTFSMKCEFSTQFFLLRFSRKNNSMKIQSNAAFSKFKSCGKSKTWQQNPEFWKLFLVRDEMTKITRSNSTKRNLHLIYSWICAIRHFFALHFYWPTCMMIMLSLFILYIQFPTVTTTIILNAMNFTCLMFRHVIIITILIENPGKSVCEELSTNCK